jgi:hypothetical protein
VIGTSNWSPSGPKFHSVPPIGVTPLIAGSGLTAAAAEPLGITPGASPPTEGAPAAAAPTAGLAAALAAAPCPPMWSRISWAVAGTIVMSTGVGSAPAGIVNVALPSGVVREPPVGPTVAAAQFDTVCVKYIERLGPDVISGPSPHAGRPSALANATTTRSSPGSASSGISRTTRFRKGWLLRCGNRAMRGNPNSSGMSAGEVPTQTAVAIMRQAGWVWNTT